LLNAVSVHQVIPRLKPGGRKTLSNGLEDLGCHLLFRQDTTGFTERKRTLIISSLIYQYTRMYIFQNYRMLDFRKKQMFVYANYCFENLPFAFNQQICEARYLLRLSSAPIFPSRSAVLPWVTDQDVQRVEALQGRYFRPAQDTRLPYRDQTLQANNCPDQDQRL
jgi:hypothetical protein